MKYSIFFTLSVALCTLAQPSAAQEDKDQVIAIVKEFFNSIEEADTFAYNQMFLPDARIYTTRIINDSTQTSSRQAIGKSTLKPGMKYLETMRTKGVKVEIHKQVAMAWVPYDFYINKAFSHCGVDVFTFMKTKRGWKIATLSYSIEKTGCIEW